MFDLIILLFVISIISNIFKKKKSKAAKARPVSQKAVELDEDFSLDDIKDSAEDLKGMKDDLVAAFKKSAEPQPIPMAEVPLAPKQPIAPPKAAPVQVSMLLPPRPAPVPKAHSSLRPAMVSAFDQGEAALDAAARKEEEKRADLARQMVQGVVFSEILNRPKPRPYGRR